MICYCEVLGWGCGNHSIVQWATATSTNSQRPHMGDSRPMSLCHHPSCYQLMGSGRSGLMEDCGVVRGREQTRPGVVCENI